eukprot:724_1
MLWIFAILAVMFQWNEQILHQRKSCMSMTYFGFAIMNIIEIGAMLLSLLIFFVNGIQKRDGIYACSGAISVLSFFIWSITVGIIAATCSFSYTSEFTMHSVHGINWYWVFITCVNIAYWTMYAFICFFFVSNFLIYLPFFIIMLSALSPHVFGLFLFNWIGFDLKIIFNGLEKSKQNKNAMVVLCLAASLGVWFFIISFAYFFVRNFRGRKYQFTVWVSICEILYAITLILIYFSNIIFLATYSQLEIPNMRCLRNECNVFAYAVVFVVFYSGIALYVIVAKTCFNKQYKKTDLLYLNWLEYWLRGGNAMLEIFQLDEDVVDDIPEKQGFFSWLLYPQTSVIIN